MPVDTCTSPIQVEGDLDLGLLGIALYSSGAGHSHSSSKRTRIELAWAVRRSASAKAMTSLVDGLQGGAVKFQHTHGLEEAVHAQGEKNRAVPEVGST